MQQQQADGSYQELWPKVDGWNKSQVLSDLTRELLGLESTSIPDDAFIALTIGKDSKAYRVKVTYPNGQPAVGFTVGGLTAFPALGLVTNANGMVMGSSTSINPTITVAQKYDDVKSYSGSFASTRMITDCNVVLEWNEAPIKKSTSTFTPNLSDYCINLKVLAVGGGGGLRSRSGGNSDAGAGGGGGGRRNYNVDTVPIKNGDTIIISIGAGGAGGSTNYTGTNGGTGGTTTVKVGTTSITASRRNGGAKASSSSHGSSTTYYSYRGRSGGTGNRNGGSGGSAEFAEDDDGDYVSGTGWSTSGSDGQAGVTVSFQGVSIATGGGGGGTGGFTWISGGPQENQPPGTQANSQAGAGGQGVTGNWGTSGSQTNAGSSGGSWIAYLHE